MGVLPKPARRALGLLTRRGREIRRLERVYAAYAPELRACTRIWGGTHVEATAPSLVRHRDAIYVPRRGSAFHLDAAWGLYASDGELIEAASYRRGPGPVRVGQSARTEFDPAALIRAPDGAYLYAGALHQHFGHFLLSGLARLWPLLAGGMPGARLVYHGDDDPEALFRRPFVAASLGALGLGPADLLRFDESSVLPEILVPGPSFEETEGAHAIHGQLGTAIGARLLAGLPCEPDPNPVFLSRDRLVTGVRRFVDEADLGEGLARVGVAIVHPETLSLAEQVSVFVRHPIVVAGLGSALHTSLLSTRPARIVAFHHETLVTSDFALVDQLKGNTADYVALRGTKTIVDPAATGFQVEFRLADPGAARDALLRLIDDRLRAPPPEDGPAATRPGTLPRTPG